MAGYLTGIAARLVRSTQLIDRAYQRFDRLRSLLVLAFASDHFIDAYGKVTYDASATFRADSPSFREGLFVWEARAIREFFPGPPARVLIGGAGGGREAFALVDQGYRVVAFDPAAGLVGSMREKAKALTAGELQGYCAGYDDLPVMPPAPGAAGLDLRTVAPFDAAILGWSSFSHVGSDAARIAALSKVSALTRGPILVSYFSERTQGGGVPSGGGILGALERRAFRRGASMFTTGIGYARLLSDRDLEAMTDRAGLRIVHADSECEFPHAILTVR
jgi:hypothetical protein